MNKQEWDEVLARDAERISRRILQFAVPSERGCLEWRRATVRSYAVMSLKFSDGWRTVFVSRVVLALAGKLAIEDSAALACHECDNPPCVLEAHLFPGSQRDNMRNAANKGRIKVPGLCGVEHPAAKLNADQVREIRQAKGALKAIGDRFGVSDFAILQIKKGRQYRSVA